MRHLPTDSRIVPACAATLLLLAFASSSTAAAAQQSETADTSQRARKSEQREGPPFGIVIAPRRKIGTDGRVVRRQSVKARQPAGPSEQPEVQSGQLEPGEGADVAQPAPPIDPPADDLPEIVPGPVRSPRYIEIYNSIPFKRSEYEANPSYRHEATMELLTGNPRPPKIYLNRRAPGGAARFAPLNPYNRPVLRQFFDFSRGPYSRYQHLFGYHGGYRPQFYRY